MTPYQNLLLAWAIDGIPTEKGHPDDKTYPLRLIEALELFFRSSIGGGHGARSSALTVPLFNTWTRFTEANPIGSLIENNKGDLALIIGNDYRQQTMTLLTTYRGPSATTQASGSGSIQHTLFMSELIRDEWRSIAVAP